MDINNDSSGSDNHSAATGARVWGCAGGLCRVCGCSLRAPLSQPLPQTVLERGSRAFGLRRFARKRTAAKKPRGEAQKVGGGGGNKAGGAVRGGHSLATVCHEDAEKLEMCGMLKYFIHHIFFQKTGTTILF